MKIGYLDCFSGMSSNRFIGALANAGVPEKILHEAVNALDIGAHLDLVSIQRNTIATTRALISLPLSEDQPPYYNPPTAPPLKPVKGSIQRLSTIQAIIAGASLPKQAKELAINTFTFLAETEAKIKGLPLEEIHFHEVKALDTIIGVTVSCVGCTWLQIDKWFASPLNVGSGFLTNPNGSLPIPTPTTLALLEDAPIFAHGPQEELLTATCAALLRALKVDFSPCPPIRINKIGYGAGLKEYDDLPNFLRLCVGTTHAEGKTSISQDVIVIETILDSFSKKQLPSLYKQLYNYGAQIVYVTPLTHPLKHHSFHLKILCLPSQAETMQKFFFCKLGLSHLHWHKEHYDSLIHYNELVLSPWGKVDVQIGQLLDNQIVCIKPNQEMCQQIAKKHDIPVNQVIATVRSLLISRKKLLASE